MATISLHGRQKVRTFEERLSDSAKINVQVLHNGAKADPNETLSSVRVHDPKTKEITIVGQTKVETLKRRFHDDFGLTTEILDSVGAPANPSWTIGDLRRSARDATAPPSEEAGTVAQKIENGEITNWEDIPENVKYHADILLSASENRVISPLVFIRDEIDAEQLQASLSDKPETSSTLVSLQPEFLDYLPEHILTDPNFIISLVRANSLNNPDKNKSLNYGVIGKAMANHALSGEVTNLEKYLEFAFHCKHADDYVLSQCNLETLADPKIASWFTDPETGPKMAQLLIHSKFGIRKRRPQLEADDFDKVENLRDIFKGAPGRAIIEDFQNDLAECLSAEDGKELVAELSRMNGKFLFPALTFFSADGELLSNEKLQSSDWDDNLFADLKSQLREKVLTRFLDDDRFTCNFGDALSLTIPDDVVTLTSGAEEFCRDLLKKAAAFSLSRGSVDEEQVESPAILGEEFWNPWDVDPESAETIAVTWAEGAEEVLMEEILYRLDPSSMSEDAKEKILKRIDELSSDDEEAQMLRGVFMD
ncbi:hypothetical protein CKO15_13475 [Halorhodospira abdelmalekii]|uniref:hypothetical protein n=1 Tax=Halorhodospira abdelmalekii TaxID=421629 RepID=UPI00190821B3|nr:hypothetical protein [Halorhodospira abdelmalekii]MBK1736254.1 hypothetical protein [Halorhodospira abdelmalekii]